MGEGDGRSVGGRNVEGLRFGWEKGDRVYECFVVGMEFVLHSSQKLP